MTNWGEPYELPNGLKINIHKREDCEGPNCPFHNPSDHSMRDFPIHWRGDRGIVERICPHGVGHPDPDNMDFIRLMEGDRKARTESIHGCDGCCVESPVLDTVIRLF